MQKNSVSFFLVGVLSAFVLSSFASIPRSSLQGVALPQEVSEIKVQRQQELHADADLERLSDLQGRYRENMPLRKRVARKSDRISTRQSAPVRARK